MMKVALGNLLHPLHGVAAFLPPPLAAGAVGAGCGSSGAGNTEESENGDDHGNPVSHMHRRGTS